MVYVTTKQSPAYKQVSIEDLLLAEPSKSYLINANTTNTRTVELNCLPYRLVKSSDLSRLLRKIAIFNSTTEHLRVVDRHDLYHSFKIPKKSGGWRKIDQPNDELMNALRLLKSILENDFGALYHTSAFAYIKNRNTLNALKRHQANESRWFSKFDIHDFFGSTTLEFVLSMLSMIYPFSELMKYKQGREALTKALELGFLNGGLPQGTPLSPTLTNIMMIPFDYRLTKKLREKDTSFVYTRYADDMLISSKYTFSYKEIETLITETLDELGAPFKLNSKKTRYGSRTGSNWNLGLMLNKDNDITIGAKRKREFKCALSNYVRDKMNGTPYDIDDVRSTLGLYSYYRMVERDNIDHIIEAFNKKHGVKVIEMMCADIA